MTVEYEKQGNVAIITINRPGARNAVNSEVAQGIEAAIDQMEADDEVWVGILTGAQTEKGYIFCAGADLKQMAVDPGGMTTAKGGFGGFVGGFGELDEARFAAAAGVDLSLHDGEGHGLACGDGLEGLSRVFDGGDHLARGNGDAEGGEQVTRLVFVDLHGAGG